MKSANYIGKMKAMYFRRCITLIEEVNTMSKSKKYVFTVEESPVSGTGPPCQSLWITVEQHCVETGLEPGQNSPGVRPRHRLVISMV